MKNSNRLRQLLMAGQPAIGAFVMIPSPDIVEMVGYAGFDFVLLDVEHGRFNTETLEHLIRAADSVDLPSVVRLPNNPSLILHTLESGCLGVQVSMVGTREDASFVVQTSRYYPEGMRGAAFFTRAGNYGTRGVEKSIEFANKEILVAIQIEGIKGVQNLPEILKVKGIDIVFIGPMDLSQSLGLPGQTNHPKVQETIEMVASQIIGAGRIPGIFAADSNAARKCIAQGFKYITIGTGAIFKSLQELVKQSRNE